MLVTADQLVAHAIGDYVLQTHWMATEKTKRFSPAFWHAWSYTLPFIFITTSMPALLVILVSHLLIDRYRLAKWVCWAKNQLAPAGHRFSPTPTGYPQGAPDWLAVWLLIICDNVLHVLINAAAIKYL